MSKLTHRIIQIIGARKINRIVFVHHESITAQSQALATALQRYHHKRAWDELVGSHKNQVMRFQQTAPRSQQKITQGVIIFVSIIPFPIVFATSVPTTAIARKLKNVAQITAYFGDKTLVDTTVAIEFALSCIPFVKSNTRAIIIIRQTNGLRLMKFIIESNI